MTKYIIRRRGKEREKDRLPRPTRSTRVNRYNNIPGSRLLQTNQRGLMRGYLQRARLENRGTADCLSRRGGNAGA